MVEVPVEPWEKEDFEKVINMGSKLLNINIGKVKNEIINSCFDSIGVLQELCKECCFSANINKTSINEIEIQSEHLEKAKTRKLEDYSGRHLRSFESFADSPKKERKGKIPLFIPYYFLNILLNTDFEDIVGGFKRKNIHKKILEIHHRPKDVRASDMSNFLYSIIKYQLNKDIKPPLFDYDRSIQTLRIIDSTLYFFLRECNKEEVLENLPVPSGKINLEGQQEALQDIGRHGETPQDSTQQHPTSVKHSSQ